MGTLQAIIYGIAQGLTEFLPVSSSGHLALLHAFFDAGTGSALTFDVALHLATAGAVIVYFRKDLTRLFFTLMRILGRLPVDTRDAVLLKAVILGCIPAGIAGLLLEHTIESMFRTPIAIAGVLLVGSGYLAYAERYARSVAGKPLTVRKGIMIGVAQVLALFPGFSRSGATIGAGMMLGLTRADSARFSFLLALPIILAAGGMKMIETLKSPVPVDWNIFLWGGLAAFVSGLFVIRFLLNYVRNHTLYPFIWYRVALATVVVIVVVLQSYA